MNIINQTAFQRFEDISLNVKPGRLNVFIAKAQELDLKPFLGYALYYDLLKNLDDDGSIKTEAPQAYKDLVNGTEYLDKRGHIVYIRACHHCWCTLPLPVLLRMMPFITRRPARLLSNEKEAAIYLQAILPNWYSSNAAQPMLTPMKLNVFCAIIKLIFHYGTIILKTNRQGKPAPASVELIKPTLTIPAPAK